MHPGLPVLYYTAGSDSSEAARAFLDGHGISHREVDLGGPAGDGVEAIRHLAGHAATPVLDWHGDILADFDVRELTDFLHAHDVVLEDS